MIEPKWTVLCNLTSPENSRWVGTSWEFFDNEEDATKAYDRHIKLGNVPTKRPYHRSVDLPNLGYLDQANIKNSIAIQNSISRINK